MTDTKHMALAICLICGMTTTDLDELDAHTATCTTPPDRGPRQFACAFCGAQPGEQCVTTTVNRIPVEDGNEHTARWKAATAARKLSHPTEKMTT